jgi:hypothetical protein
MNRLEHVINKIMTTISATQEEMKAGQGKMEAALNTIHYAQTEFEEIISK